MHIPKINLLEDKQEIIAFMKRFSFATIVTAENNFPIATHLPFLVSIKDNSIVLSSHFAKANKQWENIEQENVLIIFSEPHSYISPKNYDKKLNVPTWNYISVHVYGRGKLILEPKKVIKLLESTIDSYEISYKKQWEELSSDYKTNMLKGIVGFEVVISDIQAKKKLSQDKTKSEQKKIIDSLSKSSHNNEKLLAQFMKDDKSI
jgi:transcriptional regulator